MQVVKYDVRVIKYYVELRQVLALVWAEVNLHRGKIRQAKQGWYTKHAMHVQRHALEMLVLCSFLNLRCNSICEQPRGMYVEAACVPAC